MAVDPEDLEMFVMNSGVAGEYYGEYGGRGGHRGFAVSLDGTAELFSLGVKMAEEDTLESLRDHAPHIDSLGRGIIVSWPERLFKTGATMELRPEPNHECSDQGPGKVTY